MPNKYPRCIKNVDTEHEEIKGLKLSVAYSVGGRSDQRYVSANGYFKSPVLFSRNDPVKIAFVCPEKKNILVDIVRDSRLHDILTELECKIIAASPFPEKTRPFLLTDKAGNPQLRLKCGYVKAWKNKDKKMVSKQEALSGDNSILSMWRWEMYMFQRAYNGTWSVMWALHGAVVEPEEDEEKVPSEEESWIDEI
jgi:hypothetical protein